jgi:hypothetical protein
MGVHREMEHDTTQDDENTRRKMEVRRGWSAVWQWT